MWVSIDREYVGPYRSAVPWTETYCTISIQVQPWQFQQNGNISLDCNNNWQQVTSFRNASGNADRDVASATTNIADTSLFNYNMIWKADFPLRTWYMYSLIWNHAEGF